MKKILALLIVASFFCVCRAGAQIAHFTGAWYDTRALLPISSTNPKQAGQIDIDFNLGDSTVQVKIYYDGAVAATGTGSFSAKGAGLKVTFTDSLGRPWVGLYKNNFVSGTYKGGPRDAKGKWQANTY